MNWADELTKNLNGPQADAVRHTQGPVLALAGAGSGKTRTIVHRIGYLIHVDGVKPWRIVAVTFTNKAAQEMQQRTIDIVGPVAADCLIRTYHSFGLYLLRQLAQYLEMPASFTIWDEADQQSVIQTILTSKFNLNLNKTQVRYFAQTFSSFKDSLISPDELADEVDLDQYEYGEIMQEAYHLYEQQKKQSIAMDFADLLYQPVRVLQSVPEALEKYRNRYRYFLVDEYQDTNYAQYMLINLLAGAERNLFVVGDDDQAIYGWRGADVTNILNFNQDYPDALVIKLEENYRSTQPILDLANSVIANNSNRMEKRLFTSLTEGSLPKLTVLPDDNSEAIFIAEQIARLSQSIHHDEIAVLYRTNAQSRLFEEALLQRKIPYRVFGGTAFFARKEVKDVLAYLRFIDNPFDEVSFIRAVTTPPRGIGEKSLEKIYAARFDNPEHSFLAIIGRAATLEIPAKAQLALTELHDWITEMRARVKKQVDLGLLLEDILDRSGLLAAFEEEDRLLGTNRLEHITELKNSMLDFQTRRPEGLLSDYLQDISLYTSTADLNPEGAGKAVNLMTIHNAKGLEFEVVFITGMDEDIFPHYLAQRNGDIEEERRLFYVAVTRAKRILQLTRAKRRMMGGQYQQTRPSVFLGEIPPGMLKMEETTAATSPVATYKKTFQAPSRKPVTGEKFKNMITAAANADSSVNPNFKPGDRVKHPNFGTGKVLRIEGSGESAKIHIFFSDNKSRKFLLRYTNLEKL